jgi:hypothetical protein
MMHAYAHAMQCNYGAKHLGCYTNSPRDFALKEEELLTQALPRE